MSHVFESSFIMAQAIPPDMSIGGALLRNLTFMSISSLMVIISGVSIFGGACYLIATKQRPAALAAYLVLLPLPLLIAFCGLITGQVRCLLVIASTPGIVLTTEELAGAYAAALTEILFAILVPAPSYFVIAFGLLARTLNPPTDPHLSVSVRPQPRQPLFDATEPKPATS